MKVFPKSSYKKFCGLHFETITRTESRTTDGCFDIVGQDSWVGDSGDYYILAVYRGSVLSMSMAEREMDLKENLKPVGRGDKATGCDLQGIMQGFGWTCDEDQIWDI